MAAIAVWQAVRASSKLRRSQEVRAGEAWVLGGRTVIFLSCMHAYKDHLAAPIRDQLNDLGYYGVIVEDEPLLRGTYDVESKVAAYIGASDAFVALCTPDDRVPGHTAENIIEELGRARDHPKLRDVVLVLKTPQVTLPSNQNPVWEPLDLDQPEEAFARIRRQLATWGVEPTTLPEAPSPISPLPSDFLEQLFGGVDLGDHDKAERRIRRLFRRTSKNNQRRVAKAVFDHVIAAPGIGGDAHIPTSFLEAIARIDAALVSMDWVEQLVGSATVEHRMSAALMLWDLAETGPDMVPIDLVERLAKPATEDWYVFSPALGAIKQLALTRRSALLVLLDLGHSDDAEDRLAAVEALTDVTRVNAALLEMQPVQELCLDRDESVAAQARILRSLISRVPANERGGGYRTFGL